MGDTEDYFPRGGKKPAVANFKQTGNFLGAPEKAEKKRKKPKKKSEGDDGYLSDEARKQTSQSVQNCAVGLSYKTVKPELLVLGRIKQVMETKLQVMLPGRITGSVAACYISEAYNKQLEAYVNDQIDKVQDLMSMFRPGQYVALKVLEKMASVDNLMLSMMPHHVNSGKKPADLTKGTILQAAVLSVEDHGFVMDLGIPNTTAFLPKEKANPEVELEAGCISWVVVKSTSSSDGACVLSLASDLASLQKAFVKRSTNTPLLPGTAVDFTIDQSLDNGIEGHIFEQLTSYVQSHHADKVKGKKPSLGQKVRARVLYVMPTLKAPFLTMKCIFDSTYPDLAAEQKFKEGDIIEDAQVIKIRSKSIQWKLGPGSVGSMSLARVHIEDDLTSEEVIAKSYPIGSTHKVRVLCYHLSDYIYSVTDEPGVLSERYFRLEELTPGLRVTGTVRAVADNHVLVNVGRCIGIVPQAHTTDAGIFVDPKKATASKITKKFKVGQEVSAVVMSVDVEKQNLALTMKPSLLAPPHDVPTDYQQIQIGKAYTGTIKVVRPDYILVQFFNNVMAYIPRHYISKEPVDTSAAYHCGQIVNCTALHIDVENKKFTASFTTQPFWPNKKREKGEKRKHEKDADDETPIKRAKTEKQKKEKRKKKRRTDSETETKEESDAIDTDIHEDSDHVLTPHDLKLLNLDDCTELTQIKKRIASIKKVIRNRQTKIKRTEEKIVKIEAKGLNKLNKKLHTAMHTEKLIAEERIQKLEEAIQNAKTKMKKIKSELSVEKKESKAELKKRKETDKEELKQEKLNKKKDRKKLVSDDEKSVDSDNDDESSTVKAKVKKIKKAKIKKEEENNEATVKTKTKGKSKNKQETNDAINKEDLLKNFKVVESLEPAFKVPSAKDFWTAEPVVLQNQEDDQSSSSDEEEKELPKKKRKKLSASEKLAKVRSEEEQVRELERQAADSETSPRSCEQFERALLASPNSSQLWIAYMAFHLQATEVDKARAVGRRALNTISFREDDEKLNVWLAMINFENRFGHKDSQQKILEEALQMNEPFKIHVKLLDIYLDSGKQQELNSLVELMLRKYKRDPETYLACGSACYKADLVDKARNVMQKALVVLEKKEHVRILVQFALMERSHGASERSEALFEQVLAVYPQRVDVASVYVDMIVKTGDVDRVRQVLERMTSHKLPARKMKVLYRKWIEVEEKIGSPDHVEKIRQKALEYVEKAKF